jgi:hypothetical protein
MRNSDGADLATAVERVMSATDSEARLGQSVTLQEIDEMLDLLRVSGRGAMLDHSLYSLLDILRRRKNRKLY